MTVGRSGYSSSDRRNAAAPLARFKILTGVCMRTQSACFFVIWTEGGSEDKNVTIV